MKNDTLKLTDVLAGEIGAEASGPRSGLLAKLKTVLAGREAVLRERFEAGGGSSELMTHRSDLYDALLRWLLRHATTHVFPAANPTKGEIIFSARDI